MSIPVSRGTVPRKGCLVRRRWKRCSVGKVGLSTKAHGGFVMVLMPPSATKDICDHIITGEISEAIQSIREHFPAVLDITRKSGGANGFAATDNPETTDSVVFVSPAASPQSASASLPSSPELPPLRPHLPSHITSEKGILRNPGTGTSAGGVSISAATPGSGGGVGSGP